MMEIKISSSVIFQLIILINVPVFFVTAMPTDNEEIVVTAYPDTLKRFVDLNHVSPQVSDLLQRSNLNIQQIRDQQVMLRNRNVPDSVRNGLVIMSSSTDPSDISTNPTSREEEERLRLLSIHDALRATLMKTDMNEESNLDNTELEKAEFNYAFGPICDVPRGSDLNFWFLTESWNLYFIPQYHQYNVRSVILRVFKQPSPLEENKSENCLPSPDANEMLTITVSVNIKKRSRFTKKLIFSTMVERNYNGWLEFDVKGTVQYWRNHRYNFGLSIDAYDREDKQLDARDFFVLQDCKEGSTIPWAAFKLIDNENTSNSSAGATIEPTNTGVPTTPRLDLTSSTAAIYAGSRRARHANHYSSHNHHKKIRHSSHAFGISSNKVKNVRSDHLHRDNNSNEEET